MSENREISRVSIGRKILKLEILSSENRVAVVTTLCWAIITAGLLAHFLFSKLHISLTDALVMFAVNMAAGAVLADPGKAVVGFFASTILGLLLFFVLALLPAIMGSVVSGDAVVALWLWVLFREMVPLNTLLLFVGSIIGAGLGERYL